MQFSVVPISLRSGELDGLPLLIQYNSHGLFIALEEIGYVLMSVAFVFMGQCLQGASKRMTVLRWILRLPLAIGTILFIYISAKEPAPSAHRRNLQHPSLSPVVVAACGFALYPERYNKLQFSHNIPYRV